MDPFVRLHTIDARNPQLKARLAVGYLLDETEVEIHFVPIFGAYAHMNQFYRDDGRTDKPILPNNIVWYAGLKPEDFQDMTTESIGRNHMNGVKVEAMDRMTIHADHSSVRIHITGARSFHPMFRMAVGYLAREPTVEVHFAPMPSENPEMEEFHRDDGRTDMPILPNNIV